MCKNLPFIYFIFFGKSGGPHLFAVYSFFLFWYSRFYANVCTIILILCILQIRLSYLLHNLQCYVFMDHLKESEHKPKTYPLHVTSHFVCVYSVDEWRDRYECRSVRHSKISEDCVCLPIHVYVISSVHLTEVTMAERVLLMVWGLFLNLGHVVSECLYVSACLLLKLERCAPYSYPYKCSMSRWYFMSIL